MRVVGSGLTLLLLLFLSHPTLAATYSVTTVSTSGASTSALKVGDTVTIGYRVSAETQQICGLDSVASGYNESVIDFQSGASVPSIFYRVAIPPSTAADGLENLLTNPPVEISTTGGTRVWAFGGVSLDPYVAQPLDPGLDGVVGGGDAQFRLTFVATGVGSSTITFGSAPALGHLTVGCNGSTLPDTNAAVGVTVLPEPVPIAPPWATITLALLLGGVAAAWRQRARAGPRLSKRAVR